MHIQATAVSKVFQEHPKAPATRALSDVSLSIGQGEMVSIVGPSGSGKSTLMYCLAGLERPTDGTVQLFDKDASSTSASGLARLYRSRIGFIFQSFNLISSLSVWENVALPQRLGRKRIAKRDIDSALDMVGLGAKSGMLPSRLSGGEQQRVAVARTFASAPDVIFADEPTGSLDTRNASFVLGTLRQLANQGTTVVLVTHDLQAAALADRVVVLSDGAIQEELLSPTPGAILECMDRLSERRS